MGVLHTTQSVCPVCLQRLNAAYVQRDGAVFLEKTCPEHGAFSVPIAHDAALFLRWMPQTANIPPKEALTPSLRGCPYDCGPCAAHQQTACCVLMEITQRCNQSCPYCYASSGASEADDPPLEEIERQLDFLKAQGEGRPFNIQLSGGEPTVRKDLPLIVKMAVEKGFPYIQLNTNGRRLADETYARALKKAGVSAVFLQFDGTTDAIQMKMRGEALLETKLKAIESCRAARLPVALVPVITRGVNDGDIGNIMRLAVHNVDVVKGVHFQPVSYFGRYPGTDDGRFSMFDVLAAIEAQTGGQFKVEHFAPIATGHGLCCFTGTFTAEADGTVCATGKAGAAPPDAGDEAMVISRDRDFVKSRWTLPDEGPSCCASLDVFLNDIRSRSLTITAMHFQDAWTLDLDRVRRCRVQILRDDKLIPFCNYNITSTSGQPLYRT
ncbi:MAG: radical SAM (seleno)protein TrsS [Oscillospiraceae bacterium]